MLKQIMWVLWPSFIAAGIGVGIVFTLIDPMELQLLGNSGQVSSTMIYSLGFFVLWAIAAMASAMSCFLAVGSAQTTQDESLR